MADPSVTEFEGVADFLYAQVLELARARGRLSHFERYGLRFQAQIRRGAPGADEKLRQEGREAGKAWLAQHDPDRVMEVTSTLVSLARELVMLVRSGHVPDYLLTSVWHDLLRAAQLWQDAEGFRPEWTYVPSSAE
ncbi:hypothetical protein ACFU0X_35135 [Streptomyces cellulosae]|uniref:Uncharacterized protein n=1 Tax=Streptomyces cellulosae TaxID=1968 RepID=A0ABW6JTB1_STRCE